MTAVMDHRELYKNFSSLQEKQMQRQREHLEKMKLKRSENFGGQRNIAKKSPRQFKIKSFRGYSNVLMLSEWMYAKPMDIENYLLVSCPKGSRMTLASSSDPKEKKSILYYKNGMHMKTVKTNLPTNVVLDCIYNKRSNTIHILDIISYTHIDLTECDTIFRFFWMKTKFEEDDWRCTDDANLKLMPHCDCANTEEMIEYLNESETSCGKSELDGLLFYHKETIYISGPNTTPLVLWTFPFMLNELFDEFRELNLFDSLKPIGYTDYREFIEKFNLKQSQKKNKNKRRSGSTSNIEEMDESVDEEQKMIDLEMYGDDV